MAVRGVPRGHGKTRRWLGGALLVLAGCSATPGPPPPAPALRASSAPPAPPPPPGLVADVLPKGMRLAPPEGHLARIACLAFSPDGRQLVSGSSDRSLLVWDLETRRIVRRLAGHAGFVTACAFLPDGRWIVSGGWGGEVLVWDPAAPGPPKRLTGLRSADDVYSLRVRADGREVLAGTLYGRVMAWDVATGAVSFDRDDLRQLPNSIVWAVGYLEDGTRFAGGQSGAILWEKVKPRRIDGIRSSGLPLPGGRLLLGDAQGLALIEPSGAQRRIGKHEDWVYGLALSPRRDGVIAGDQGGHTRLWSLPGGELRCELPASGGIAAADFDPSGARFAVAGKDATVVIAGAADCAITHRLQASRGRISRVAAGTSVLLGDSAGRVSAWSPAAFRLQESVPVHAGEVKALTVLPDGRWVSGGLDFKVAISAPPSVRTLGQLWNAPWRLQPTTEGTSVLTVDASGRLTALSLDGSKSTELFHTGGAPLFALALRPGKAEAVVGGAIPDIHRLVLPKGDEDARWQKLDPKASPTALAYSPDGRWLAEGDTDGNVALRNADTGAIERRLSGLHKSVQALLFTRDHLWAGGYDQHLVRWPLSAGTDPDLPPSTRRPRYMASPPPPMAASSSPPSTTAPRSTPCPTARSSPT